MRPPGAWEEWLQSHGWQLGEKVNDRALAAPLPQGEASFSPIEQIDFEDKDPVVPRSAASPALCTPVQPFFSGGTLLDATPWLQTLGRWRCRPAP